MSWTLIEHQALTSSVSSVTLGSGGTLPQTYKTLKLVVSARTTRTAFPTDAFLIRPNGSSASMTSRRVLGSGSAASSDTGTGALCSTDGATSNTFGSTDIVFPNYTGSTNKPISVDAVSENNATEAYQGLLALLWSNTAAITSIQIVPETGPNFASGSTFTLYGLA